jgi:cytochrome b561
MSMKSTAERYGTVVITLHWITALLIAGLLARMGVGR